MGIRQVPPSIKDPNLAGFLRELRAAIGGVSDQVTKIIATRSSSGSGGGGGGGGGGGTDPGPGDGGGGGGGTTPTQASVVLTISPIKPLTEEDFTLTATVTGNAPTGRVNFRRNGDLMTLDPYQLPSSGVITHTDKLAKGIYTFVAEYSGDFNNLAATSNVLTVEIGSMWDGPPAALTSLTAESGINFITLKWTLPYTGDLDVVEIWMSESGTMTLDAEGTPTNATQIGESNGSMLVWVPPVMGTTYYFWGRVRDAEGLFSDFYPALDAGVPGAAVSLEDEIAGTELWGDLGDRIGLIETDVDGIHASVTTLEGGYSTLNQVVARKNRIFRQATAPSNPYYDTPGNESTRYDLKVNDIWISTATSATTGTAENSFYRWTGSLWEKTDPSLLDWTAAAVSNKEEAKIGYCSISQHKTKAACAAAGGTWYDLPFATAVKQVGVTTSDGKTATVEQLFEAVEGPDGLTAQYMVKTDVNGLVSGFGLFNDGEVSDFFVRADRFAVGNPASYRGGTCSIAGHTTADACTAAGGTWTWTNANATNIPFIVYTTPQTITAPDGSGRTLTIQPGVYMKSANIQKAFIGDAEIYGDLKSYTWAASGGPTTFPFNGWKLDKASNLALYGGSFALYDEYGSPIIQSGKIAFSSFKRLIVSANAELFTIAKPPSTTITPSTITLNAVLQNISGTVTWSVTSGTYGGTLGTGVQKTIDPAQMTTATVTFKASTTVDSVVYEDYVTLAKVQEGSDSLWLYLSNEAHLVPADAAGVVSSYAGASTIAKVYRGATDVTTSEGWTISAASYTGLSGTPDVSGTTVGFADGSPSMTADTATVTVRASKSGENPLDRIFTVAKAKQGASGRSLMLQADSLVRSRSKAGVISPALINLTAVASGVTGTVTFYKSDTRATLFNTTWFTDASAPYEGILDAAATNATYGDWPLTNKTYYVGARWTDGTTTLEDVLTFAEVEEGSDAITVVLSNDNHTFTADNAGNVTSFVGSGCTISVYEGANQLPAVVAGGNGTFKVITANITGNPSGKIGFNGITHSGNLVTINDYASFDVDTPSVVLTIPVTVTKSNGTSLTVNKTITLSKAKQGLAGSAYTVVLTNEASIVPFTGGTGDYSDTPTTVLVYSGSTQLGTTSAAEWFQVTSAVGSGILAGTVSGANIGAASNITASSATITITVAIKDSTGATKATITKVQSITKTENGAFVRLTTTSQVLRPKADNSDYDPRPTLNLVTANVTGTPTWQYRRTTAAGVGNWASAGTPTLPWTLDFSANGSTWIAATTAMEYRVTVGGITDQITMPVVRDGATGATGPAGVRGSVNAYITTFSAAAAWNAIVGVAGSNPVVGDWVWTQAGNRHAYTSGAYPGNWTSGQSTQFSGTVIVDGTLTANKLYAGQIGSHLIELGAYNNDPNAIIQSRGFVSGSNGWRIRGNGDAEFNTTIVRSGANLAQNAITKIISFSPSEIYNYTTAQAVGSRTFRSKVTEGGDYAIILKSSVAGSWYSVGEEVFFTGYIPTLPFALGRTTNVIVHVAFEVPDSSSNVGIADGVMCQLYLTKRFLNDQYAGTGYKGCFVDGVGSADASWTWNSSTGQLESTIPLANEFYMRRGTSSYKDVKGRSFSSFVVYKLSVGASEWLDKYTYFYFRVRARHTDANFDAYYRNPRITIQAFVE